jgi:protein-tyrosine phosphatase
MHAHVLPGLDDGAANDIVALEMLRMAATDGITRIVATPHASRITREQVSAGVERLNQLARDAGVMVEVLGGSEVRYAPDLANRYLDGQLITINRTSYALIEFPFQHEWPALLTTTLYTMMAAGMTPIMAHAERYPVVQVDPAVLVPLVEMGLLVQVNSEALLGATDAATRATAELLLQARLIHLVASDAHDPLKRPPRLRPAYERVTALADAEYARWLRHAAQRVVADEPLVTPRPDSAALKPPRGWFRLPWR